MWELDCEESWAPKNWCFWTVVLEKTLERPLDCKEIQPVHSKGDQSWEFIGRTDAKAETQYFGHLTRSVDSLEKTLMLGGIGGRRRRGRQRMRWLDGITDSMHISGSWWWTGRSGMLRFMGSQRIGHDWVTELNWTIILGPFWQYHFWGNLFVLPRNIWLLTMPKMEDTALNKPKSPSSLEFSFHSGEKLIMAIY